MVLAQRIIVLVAVAAVAACSTAEQDCDTVYGALRSGVLEHGKLPKDAADRDRLAKALQDALDNWKTARASVKSDEARRLADGKAKQLEARVQLLRAVRFVDKDQPAAPVAGAAASPEAAPSASAAASGSAAPDAPMTRKEALEAATDMAVGGLVSSTIPKASRDALQKNYEAAKAANDALSNWCIDSR